MLDPRRLLADLLGEVRRVEDDLRSRLADGQPEEALRTEYERAVRRAETTAPWRQWRDEQLDSAAVAWVLGTAMVRFLEDNQLLTGAPLLSGPNKDAIRAAELAQDRWLAANPSRTSVDWLLMTFGRITARPGGLDGWGDAAETFARFRISATTADALIAFWRKSAADGVMMHYFRDPQLSTDFIEVLYEGLSSSARTRHALMPTPEFVVSLLLDHTLDPAIDEFGLAKLRIIDPACGSGRILVAAFERLVNAWGERLPATNRSEHVAHSLRAVFGADINPPAVAITRFRLLVAALRLSGLHSVDAIAYGHEFNIVIRDALLASESDPSLAGSSSAESMAPDMADSENRLGRDQQTKLDRVLQLRRYQVVVSEPPYLTVPDRARDAEYRRRYSSCVGAYALTVPFAELMYSLAVPGDSTGHGAGYVGQFISNSFMKREFGKKLVEEFYARRATITHVLDTSGAYIPGRGTPTVVLIGRNRPPGSDARVLVVAGLRGEPALPTRPEDGVVWQSIVQQSRRANLTSEWSRSFQVDHDSLHTHPWSLATPRVDTLLKRMSGGELLSERAVRIGYAATTGSDSIFVASPRLFQRIGAEAGQTLVPVITGSEVRDWTANAVDVAYFPRDRQNQLVDIKEHPRHHRRLWPYRTSLFARQNYSGRSYRQDGRAWYDWHQIASTQGTHEWSIVFSWVATHNQFALLRERAMPLNSAPVVKLPQSATKADHDGLVALLNSSAACFWMKQHSPHKRRSVPGQHGTSERWTDVYEFAPSRLRDLPLPGHLPAQLGALLVDLEQKLVASEPAAVLAAGPPISERLGAAKTRWNSVRARMVALQEELDWEIYRLYGLTRDDALVAPLDSIPDLLIGERAFEVILARSMHEGEETTRWFERHGATAIVRLPADWPPAYRDVVLRRIQAIGRTPELELLERPEFKRRWTKVSWDDLQAAALKDWILDRCEDPRLWFDGDEDEARPRPLTIEELARRVGADPAVVEAAKLYDPSRALVDVIASCIEEEHVPYLTALRLRESGLAKRAEWERVWQQQHGEDIAGSAQSGVPPTPPGYASSDYLRASYWRLRGKLDVPGERFISYPQVPSTGKRNLLLGWAAWDEAQRAQVLEDLITSPVALERGSVVPLLAGLREILPFFTWSRASTPPESEAAAIKHYTDFISQQLHRWGLTVDDLRSWRPPRSRRGRPPKSSMVVRN